MKALFRERLFAVWWLCIRFGLDAIAGSIAAVTTAPATLLGESAILPALCVWLLLRAGRLRQSVTS
ncbi:MAG: hypothetical protein NTY05_11670 [Rhodocyclales bacterium]|nr:hypothetical protein [Rhodocyclales bacterium]